MKRVIVIVSALLLIIISINTFPEKFNKNETIIFPSTYGWISDGEVFISLHAWVFKMKEDSISRNSFINLLKKNFETATDPEKKNFDERIRYFLADNQRGVKITFSLTDKLYTLPETTSNGHTFSIIRMKDIINLNSISSEQSFQSVKFGNESKTFTGSFRLIGSRGYSVISDIDDTIKDSNVLNKHELLHNTFFRKFTPVKGMPDLYRKLLEKGAEFHYVSGSPWQLYPAIENFLHDEKFPEGAVELKIFRVKDKSFIDFIKADQLAFKLEAIKTIIDRFPEREFILIGDSGEKDPEVYTEIANIYKTRIKYILIRDVGLIEENSSRRKTILEKSGNLKLVIFKNPDELEPYITGLQ